MSLRDQMLKAGLITEEQARKATHQQRVQRKQADPKTRAKAQEARQQEARKQKDAERSKQRQQSRQQAEQSAAKEATHADRQRQRSAVEIAYRDGLIERWEGARRYYYAVQGRIECLMVNDDVARKLEGGLAAIVAAERNPRRHVPMLAGPARQLQAIAAERVLVLHTN